MAVRETPGQGCQNGSKNSLEFCHVNTLKMSSFRLNGFILQKNKQGHQTLKRKSHFIVRHVTKYSTILGVFQQPWPGVSPTTILNEEKALGMRLLISRRKSRPKQQQVCNFR